MKATDYLNDSTEIRIVNFDEDKVFTKFFNISEFVGEELCKMNNIPSAHYFVLTKDDYANENKCLYKDLKKYNYYYEIGSYDFRKDNCDYYKINELDFSEYKNNFYGLLNMTKDDNNKKDLERELLKLFALDFYMGQIDRYSDNIMLEYSNKGIHLSPLYDFEYSLNLNHINKEFFYKNDIYNFYSIDDFKILGYFYPEFFEYLENYLDIDLVSVLESSLRSRGLNVLKRDIRRVDEFQKEKCKTIKKIIR
ncbi:MAG: hypothetical protein IJ842_04005 [Bacilli bacterium]|nr:hypothetical protein [Bacilli bacterium]